MEDREQLLKSSPEFDRLCFTVLAIEASAQKMGISPSEMRRRLDKVGLWITQIVAGFSPRSACQQKIIVTKPAMHPSTNPPTTSPSVCCLSSMRPVPTSPASRVSMHVHHSG